MKKLLIVFFNLILVLSMLFSGGCADGGYTIEYDLEGGKLSDQAVYKYTEESGQITLTNPTRIGYKFVGWIVNSDDTPIKDFTFDASEGGDRQFIAVWEKAVYKVYLNLYYVLNYDDEVTIVVCKYRDLTMTTENGFEVNYGDKIIDLYSAEPIDSDSYSFSHWQWIDSQGKEVEITSTTTFDENTFGDEREIIMDAVCESNYTPNA